MRGEDNAGDGLRQVDGYDSLSDRNSRTSGSEKGNGGRGMNYEELVKALRFCARWHRADDALANAEQAADAIEALQAEIRQSMQRCAECGDELAQQLPKRGKWVEDTTTYAGPGLSNYKCSLCGKICGTWRRGLKPSELPNWCGNCGADMRKMEVQDG